MTVEPTPQNARELLAAEDDKLARCIAFVRDGVRGNRISPESAEALISLAEHEHHVRTALLRELLDGQE